MPQIVTITEQHSGGVHQQSCAFCIQLHGATMSYIWVKCPANYFISHTQISTVDSQTKVKAGEFCIFGNDRIFFFPLLSCSTHSQQSPRMDPVSCWGGRWWGRGESTANTVELVIKCVTKEMSWEICLRWGLTIFFFYWLPFFGYKRNKKKKLILVTITISQEIWGWNKLRRLKTGMASSDPYC